jgi:thymidylate synthase ThyX
VISAKVIEDSVGPNGVRITTLQLCYPRFIHAEFMTHRVFSRNASSSRAIPVAKMLEMVRNEPAMPIHWGKNQPGMQANERLIGEQLEDANCLWLLAATNAARVAESMNALGLHKQVANRILEPFQHIHVIVTATEWENFFALRDHRDAQPEIRELAIQMKLAFAGSTPSRLKVDQWHLPYVTRKERLTCAVSDMLKCSAARCARVSYLTHDGLPPNIEKDVALYERLVGGEPIHASPIEHQAMAGFFGSANLWSGNFKGWIQHRKMIE